MQTLIAAIIVFILVLCCSCSGGMLAWVQALGG